MGEILFYVLLTATFAAALVQPWIGVLAAYLFVLLTPQDIWPWVFHDVRPVFWIAVPTLIGFLLSVLRGHARLDGLKSKLNLFFVTWWLFVGISYFWGPYVNVGNAWRFFEAGYVFEILNKAFVFYFVAVLCIDDDRKLKYLTWIMTGAMLYLIYWSNAQYLSGSWLGPFGRLTGPGNMDENGFAMLFVTGLPFLYYVGCCTASKVVRYGLWLAIPFGWHAVFLTGSRGGLIGLGLSLVVMAIRLEKRWLGGLLVAAFVVAFVWQAGDVMKERAWTIREYESVSSAQTRFQAWDAALRMISAHPVTGVGLASFGAAFANYSDHRPREAHNTFFQIAAESGLMAGLAWLSILLYALRRLWKGTARKPAPTETGEKVYAYYTNEAVLVALVGFGVCSTFLTLHLDEVFFYLAILANYLIVRANQREAEASQTRFAIDSKVP